MKTLKLKSIAFGLVATFMFAIAIQSCTQQELPVPTDPGIEANTLNVEPTTTQLTQDDPVVVGLKASEDIKNYNTEAGELLWDLVSITHYNDGETLPVIIVPIENGETDMVSMLTIAYNEADNKFAPIISSFSLSDESDTEYSGTIEYKTVDNYSMVKKTISEGVVVSYEEFDTNEIASRGTNMSCFQDCLRAHGFSSIAVGLGGACARSVGWCINAPSPYNPACWASAACVIYYGGRAAWCYYDCR